MIISEIDLDNYLEHKFIPYVKDFYAGSSSGPNDINSLITAIVNIIKAKGTSIGEVSLYGIKGIMYNMFLAHQTLNTNVQKDNLVRQKYTRNKSNSMENLLM